MKEVKVFDKMLSMERRQEFIERKDSSFNITDEELELIKEYVMSDECTKDIERLKSGDFFFSVPTAIRLRKSNSDKRRTVYRFQDRERTLMKYMAHIMHDYDYMYTDSLYSFRMGRHISRIFDEITRLKCAENCWVIKGDIKGFGDNVDPEYLCDQLTEIYEKDDPELLAFFKNLLLRGEYYYRNELIKDPTGAMSGCALTNFFENVYLLDMDDMIREKAVYYCRFADDIAIFVNTKEEAEAMLDSIYKLFSGRGLRFNESKTEIVPPGARFELLGFAIEGSEYDIADSSVAKIEWKLRHRAKKYVRMYRRGWITKEEAEQKMIDRVQNYFYKRDEEKHEINWVDWAFRILTRDDSLKKLDTVAQSCIRYAGSGGKNTDAKYKVRYKDMRKRGYRPLVHFYYHKKQLRQFYKDIGIVSK